MTVPLALNGLKRIIKKNCNIHLSCLLFLKVKHGPAVNPYIETDRSKGGPAGVWPFVSDLCTPLSRILRGCVHVVPNYYFY